MELYFANLLSYFTRFHFACGVAAFNTLWAQIAVSLLVEDRPSGLRGSYCLGFFLLSLCADY